MFVWWWINNTKIFRKLLQHFSSLTVAPEAHEHGNLNVQLNKIVPYLAIDYLQQISSHREGETKKKRPNDPQLSRFLTYWASLLSNLLYKVMDVSFQSDSFFRGRKLQGLKQLGMRAIHLLITENWLECWQCNR